MANSFVKVWASILDSSVWSTPPAHRLVWITMLAMADQHGFVHAAIDGIARRANVPLEDAEAALAAFQSPDPNSRDRIGNDTVDGRRVEAADRGWHIINHGYYRDLRDREERREYERVRKAKQRASARNADGTVAGREGTPPPLSQMSAHAEAEAEAEAMDGRMDGGVPGSVPESTDLGTRTPPRARTANRPVAAREVVDGIMRAARKARRL